MDLEKKQINKKNETFIRLHTLKLVRLSFSGECSCMGGGGKALACILPIFLPNDPPVVLRHSPIVRYPPSKPALTARKLQWQATWTHWNLWKNKNNINKKTKFTTRERQALKKKSILFFILLFQRKSQR